MCKQIKVETDKTDIFKDKIRSEVIHTNIPTECHPYHRTGNSMYTVDHQVNLIIIK